MRDKVWALLLDPEHDVSGLIAIDQKNTRLGVAHYRPFYRPLSATFGGFLDDLNHLMGVCVRSV